MTDCCSKSFDIRGNCGDKIQMESKQVMDSLWSQWAGLGPSSRDQAYWMLSLDPLHEPQEDLVSLQPIL